MQKNNLIDEVFGLVFGDADDGISEELMDELFEDMNLIESDRHNDDEYIWDPLEFYK